MNQPTRDQLLRAIQQALPNAIPQALTTATGASDLYEAFLFSEVAAAAQAQGAIVAYETVTGTPAQQLLFRTSPGQIYSRAQRYTHAILRFGGRPALELHIGVRVEGQSGVLHECDVLVLTRAEAQNCRALQVAPRSASSQIAIEAKFYATPLGVGLGRAFLGLIGDLSTPWPCLVTNSSSGSIAKLFARRRSRHFYQSVIPARATNARAFFETAFSRYAAA